MSRKVKGMVLVAMTGLFLMAGGSAFANGDLVTGIGTADSATGGGIEGAAIGELGDTDHGPPVERLLDLPALKVDVDADGRVIMDLPALKLVGPAKPVDVEPPVVVTPAPERPVVDRPAPDRLPVTGANVGDIFALGMAALSGGGVFLRRLRLSLAS